LASYDVVLIHPPSLYDFRREIWFPGPIARTVPNYTPVFMMFPIGLISIGAYLQDQGVKVKIFNLAEKMATDKDFNAEQFLQGLDSKVYAIDLHWAIHSQGAIKVAEICKNYHPDSKIILGGLTATCFAEEIVSSFPFVDCVIRGEGEEPLFRLINNIEKTDVLRQTPNLTFLDRERGIARTETLPVLDDIDSLDFTRLELVEPNARTLTSPIFKTRLWNLPICRGCTLNCATCGGSSYSYKKLMNRYSPAFRSPKKLLEDFTILDKERVDSIFLFQDPRLGGEKYVRQLLDTLKGSRWSHIRNVGLELFYPADRSFIRYLSENKPAENVGLSISPESGVDSVRRVHGRNYSNGDLLRTCQYCRELNVPLGVFFMIGLGHETFKTMRQMWSIWKKIGSIEKKVKGRYRIFTDFGPMIFLDPGSLAFDYPERYGYKLKFKRFNDYYRAMRSPHWMHWISYETLDMRTLDLANSIIESSEKLLDIKKEHSMITEKEHKQGKLLVDLDRIFVSEFDEIMKIEDPDKRNKRIRELFEISKDPLLSLSYVLTQSKRT